MFGRLVQKELLHHVLDFRFVAIFALCTLLSVLSVYVGIQNYRQRQEQYQAVSASNREVMRPMLERGNVLDLVRRGIDWNRPPEVLSPVVYGLSGKLGHEVRIRYQRPARFEDSLFSVDPIHALFGVLDVAFIVKIILSLCVLLLTYDAICGEKEGGTLRLYASFPVSRPTLALAKLMGTSITALVPFVFAFLLVMVVLALSPDLGLEGDDWLRMAASMGVFGLYLVVFAAFGLFVSGLSHRRMTAFLGLLALWTIWIFVMPNVAVRLARAVAPVESIYDQAKQSNLLRWEALKGSKEERDEAWEQLMADKGGRIRRVDWEGFRKKTEKEIYDRWDAQFYDRLNQVQSDRKNQMRRQHRLAAVLSMVSPMSAVSFTAMDLARTGFLQQERIEDALSAYTIYMARLIEEKRYAEQGPNKLNDFVWFDHTDTEEVGACLARNAVHILNLVLLAVLGFAGAYVAILRYDVR